MTTTDASAALAPALIALGGWTDAAWFCPTILSDDEVVGFTFPKLPGLRKQSYSVIDRATLAKPNSRQAKAASMHVPKRLRGKVVNSLEDFGATRAVACCRLRLLFDTGPILFFGEFPASKVKQRAANKLRRDLIDLGVHGCVLRVEEKSVIGMFWSSAEVGITDFVNAASPDFPLHADFSKPGTSPKVAGAKAAASSGGKSEKLARDRETQLLTEIVALRKQVDALKKGTSPLAAMEQLGLDEARLKAMLKLLHPDKHGNSDEANEAAKWLNNLRDLLKGKPQAG